MGSEMCIRDRGKVTAVLGVVPWGASNQMVESTYTFIVWAYLVRAKIIYIDATFCG